MSDFTLLDNGSLLYKKSRVGFAVGKNLVLEIGVRRNTSFEVHNELDVIVRKFDSVKYVNTLKDHFDPRAAYTRFLSGEFPEGVEFTQEETAVLKVLEGVKEKIKKTYALPELPYTTVDGIDFKTMFGDRYDDKDRQSIMDWLAGTPGPSSPPYTLSRHATNYLRLHTATGRDAPNYVYNLSGHKIGIRTFTTIFNTKLKPYWTGESTTHIWRSHVQGYNLEVTPTAVRIGCQTMPRSEVERIAKQLGLI